MKPIIYIKRVYEAPSAGDGYRVLVDRLWPRGLAKNQADVDNWSKDIAPSNELRKWFGHEAPRWAEFQEKYAAELDENPATAAFIALVKKHKTITLLYGAKDEAHNQAVVLQQYLGKKIR